MAPCYRGPNRSLDALGRGRDVCAAVSAVLWPTVWPHWDRHWLRELLVYSLHPCRRLCWTSIGRRRARRDQRRVASPDGLADGGGYWIHAAAHTSCRCSRNRQDGSDSTDVYGRLRSDGSRSVP